MNSNALRATAALALVSSMQIGCYSAFRISNDELQTLTSGHIAERVDVTTESGEVVEISATSPIEVRTVDGARYNVSPFNFTFDQNGLIAPDYDLLLQRDEVDGARVFRFAKGRTIGVLIGSIVAAGGGFAAVSILAQPKEQ